MLDFLIWWLIVVLLGLILFPFVSIIFRDFPNQGYPFSKTIGIILGAYIYWILLIFGLLPNVFYTAYAVFGLLILISLFFTLYRKNSNFLQWIKENKSQVIFSELLFFVSFAFWAYIRTSNPMILGTEKPMELAFINATLRSPAFPPSDPWLSGYSISYYYFGYIIIAWLIQITGSISSVGYNLAIALVFALTAINSQAILFAVLKRKVSATNPQVKPDRNRRLFLISLLAPLYILIVSNSEGLLEVLHNRGIFWNKETGQSEVWEWINIRELNKPPEGVYLFEPEKSGRTWWWRASRVLEDITSLEEPREIIDEFPFFSFLLADLHPHVIAIPIILILISLGLVVLWKRDINDSYFQQKWKWFREPTILMIGFIFGIIAFTNTWDLPICVLFILCTLILNSSNGINFTRVKNALFIIIFCLMFGIGIVLPFFLGFSSQAGGILPSMIYFTKTSHFLVMFFPLLLPIFVFGLSGNRKKKSLLISTSAMLASIFLAFIGMFLLAAFIFGGLGAILSGNPGLREMFGKVDPVVSQISVAFLGIFQVQTWAELVANTQKTRLSDPGTIIILASLGTLILNLLIKSISAQQGSKVTVPEDSISIFTSLLIFMGLLVTIFPEFFYLRDVFGWRMNTIFKFYYQAWIFWGLAASIATAFVLLKAEKRRIQFVCITLAFSTSVGLFYPFFAIKERMQNSSIENMTLDGNAYLQQYQPDVIKAANALLNLPYGYIIEAVGGSYSGFARYATITGYPNILGWPGHEMQWRGGVREIGNREQDVRIVYETSDWNTAREILKKYQVRYIIVGELEQAIYQIQDTKFLENTKNIFSSNQVKIFSLY